MKPLTTMTAIAALIAGVSFAQAQNSANTNSPSSINAKQHSTDGAQSGSENGTTAKMKAPGNTAREAQSNGNVPPSSINAKEPDTNSNKSGNETTASKKMRKSTTGMSATEKSESTVSPANKDAKESGTFSSKSGSQTGGTGPSK